MKSNFRRTRLSPPKYPTREAAGSNGRAILIAAGLLIAAPIGCGEDDTQQADSHEQDAGVDAGRDAQFFVVDSGGVAPFPDAGTPDDAGMVVDSGGIAPMDAGDE